MSPSQYLVQRILALENSERKYRELYNKHANLAKDNKTLKTKLAEQEAYIRQLETSLKELSTHVIKLGGAKNDETE